MPVVVVTPPEPIVTPADIAGDHDEGYVTAAILAAIEEIDGPNGSLGRALGPQTLELTLDGWEVTTRLPCRPIISVDEVAYIDVAGAEQLVDSQQWDCDRAGNLRFHSAWTPPALGFPRRVRVLYQAGYDGENTGHLPERARQAVILMVQDMLRTGATEPGLRSETVEGLGTETFMDADRASAMTSRAVEALLAGLRVYSL